MKWKFCLLLFLLTGCTPSMRLVDHQGCRVPAVFDEWAQDFAYPKGQGLPAPLQVEQGYFGYLLLPPAGPDGQIPVVITNQAPDDLGYLLESSDDKDRIHHYVHPGTGAVWVWGSDDRGTWMMHSCM